MRIAAAFMLLLVASIATAESSAQRPLLALCYHDVVESYEQTLLDPTAITVDTLVQHFSWLAAEGYQPVTLAQWHTGEDLPKRPVLLTFDDGYANFRRHVLPLLELFRFHAVLAPVTSWIDAPANQPIRYGDQLRPRSDFLTWEEVREAQSTGLVEIASHTHQLHEAVRANPGGSMVPAAVAHAHSVTHNVYETEVEYRNRLWRDLTKNAVLITENLETIPSAIVWPYGAYNATANELAGLLGMRQVVTLADGENRPGSGVIHRHLVNYKTDLSKLKFMAEGKRKLPKLRAAEIRLDDIYDPDPLVMERNFDALLERVKDMHISGVFLQAFSDRDEDGFAEALYFPNQHMPMRADLFSRVAWQLKTRANVQVFAWLPVLAFDTTVLPNVEQVSANRMDPRSSSVRSLVRDIYSELGRYARFDGVVFHDDAYLSNEEVRGRYTVNENARLLVDFTQILERTLAGWQGSLRTVRTLHASALARPHATTPLARNYADFLEQYDYTALLTSPASKPVDVSARDLKALVAKVEAVSPDALPKSVFVLPTKRVGRVPISNAALGRQFDQLIRAGAPHIAYQSDAWRDNHPAQTLVRSHISTNWYPAVKR